VLELASDHRPYHKKVHELEKIVKTERMIQVQAEDLWVHLP